MVQAIQMSRPEHCERKMTDNLVPENGMAVLRPLISLATDRGVNTPRLFIQTCEKLTLEELARHYRAEVAHAPNRAGVGKPYLVATHQGIPSTGAFTNRNEEHLALAIFDRYGLPSAGLQLPDGEELHILDYQLPLKARRTDSGVGKVDLFGITGAGQAAVIELKAAKGGDTPLRALLEGLAYTAIVQANVATLRQEVQQRYDLTIATDVPRLFVMAPEEYRAQELVIRPRTCWHPRGSGWSACLRAGIAAALVELLTWLRFISRAPDEK
jgi:hypothetical protein